VTTPWWATAPKTFGEGYAEGSDNRLAMCEAKIRKHLNADVEPSVMLQRIRSEVAVWTAELKERGML